MAKAKGGKKQRKHGRNALSCKQYTITHRREHNKIRRLKKHLIRFPDDAGANKAIERCMVTIRGY